MPDSWGVVGFTAALPPTADRNNAREGDIPPTSSVTFCTPCDNLTIPGEVIVADFEATPIQGDPAKSVVVLKFPSEQAIRDFIDDPDYKPAKDLRLAITTNANAVMAPEFKPPQS